MLSDPDLELPDWVRVCASSREEPSIVRALKRRTRPGLVEKLELKPDDPRHDEDLRTFLAACARGTVDDDLSLEAVERDAERRFPGVAVRGTLADLGDNVRAIKRAYADVMEAVKLQPGYDALARLEELRPTLVSQVAESVDALLEDATRARTIVAEALADDWSEGSRRSALGGKRAFVDRADDAGVKSEAKVREQAAEDYDGDFARLCDVARFTLCFKTPDRLLSALDALGDWELVRLKNRFASPTPLGYVGVDACFLVPLPGRDGPGHVVEFELTLDGVDAAKGQLHSRYDQYEPFVSRVLPERLAGSAAAAFVARRLRNSGLDAVVDCLARKAGGVFSYAKLLADHVDLAGADLDDLHGLPDGLDNIYAHLATLADPAQRATLRSALPRPETAEDDGAEEEEEVY